MSFAQLGLRSLLLFLSQQLADDLIDDLIGQRPDLIFGLWLDWMFDEDRLVLGHAKGGALSVGCTNEFSRGHVCGRDALFFKVDDIVRTARNTAPSITEGFNDGVTLLRQLGFQRCRRAPGDCGLHSAQHVFDAVLFA